MQSSIAKFKYTREVVPTSPFNFDATFFKPDHFTPYDFEFAPGKRRTTANIQNNTLGLVFRNLGDEKSPKVAIDIYSKKEIDANSLNEIVEELIFRYNLRFELDEFYAKFSDNKYLKSPITNLLGMRPGHPSSLYEYIMIGIMLQNASIRRSIQMYKVMLEKYGEAISFDDITMHSFWAVGDFAVIDEQELRDLKVGYRAKSFKRVDQYFSEGKIDEIALRESDDSSLQKEELLKIYGVGPATVWYLMFDVFHRWELFEHVSPWEQKIYSKLFFNRSVDDLVPVNEILSFIDQFGEYRHLAIHYLWEDLWWRLYKGEKIEWLEKEIRR